MNITYCLLGYNAVWKVSRRFGGTYCLHIHVRVSRTKYYYRESMPPALLIRCLRWRLYVPPKRRLTSTDYAALYPRKQYSLRIRFTVVVGLRRWRINSHKASVFAGTLPSPARLEFAIPLFRLPNTFGASIASYLLLPVINEVVQ
jgi:hypothetical protein